MIFNRNIITAKLILLSASLFVCSVWGMNFNPAEAAFDREDWGADVYDEWVNNSVKFSPQTNEIEEFNKRKYWIWDDFVEETQQVLCKYGVTKDVFEKEHSSIPNKVSVHCTNYLALMKHLLPEECVYYFITDGNSPKIHIREIENNTVGSMNENRKIDLPEKEKIFINADIKKDSTQGKGSFVNNGQQYCLNMNGKEIDFYLRGEVIGLFKDSVLNLEKFDFAHTCCFPVGEDSESGTSEYLVFEKIKYSCAFNVLCFPKKHFVMSDYKGKTNQKFFIKNSMFNGEKHFELVSRNNSGGNGVTVEFTKQDEEDIEKTFLPLNNSINPKGQDNSIINSQTINKENQEINLLEKKQNFINASKYLQGKVIQDYIPDKGEYDLNGTSFQAAVNFYMKFGKKELTEENLDDDLIKKMGTFDIKALEAHKDSLRISIRKFKHVYIGEVKVSGYYDFKELEWKGLPVSSSPIKIKCIDKSLV